LAKEFLLIFSLNPYEFSACKGKINVLNKVLQMDTSTSKPRKKSIFLSVNRAWRSILATSTNNHPGYISPDDCQSPKPLNTTSPDMPVPTFGDIPPSSARSQRHRSVVLEDGSDQQIRTPRSESRNIIPSPRNNNGKKFAKKLSKMNTMFYMNRSNDNVLGEPDEIPSILNEYKYRRMDTSNILNDQDKTSKSDPKKYSFSSTPMQKDHESPLANFDNSRSTIHRSPVFNTKKDQKPQLRSLNSHYWIPSAYNAKSFGV